MIRYVKENIMDLFDTLINNKPNNIGYTFLEDKNRETSITYQELYNKILGIAAVLQQHAQSKERIVLIYPPGLQLIAAFLGCLHAGMVAVLVHPPQTEDLALKLQLIIDVAQPALFLSTNNIAEKIKVLGLNKGVKKASMQNEFTKFMPSSTSWGFDKLRWVITDTISPSMGREWVRPLINKDDIAFLQYTSGSTGTPKGVIVTHHNLLCNLAAIKKQFNFTEKDDIVFWLPPYHDMGLVGGILSPLYITCPCRLMSPLRFLKFPLSWLETITRYHSTITAAPNFAYDFCTHRITEEQKNNLNLSSLKNVLVGAEPVRKSSLDNFAKAFKACGFSATAFKPCYGLAENTLIVTGVKDGNSFKYQILRKKEFANNKLSFDYKQDETTLTLVGSGEIIDEHQLIIVNPQTKTRVPENNIGEIWVSGPCVTPGYWPLNKIPKISIKAVLAGGKATFLKTGDLGFIKDGELYVCGRIKDMIILHGRNYYPQDIEIAIEHELPKSIRHGCSVAFSMDILEQERLVIVTELRKTNAENYKELSQQITQILAQEFGLCAYYIVFVPEKTLKKTTSGKIRRQHTKEQFKRKRLEIIFCWSNGNRETLETTTREKQIAHISSAEIEDFIKTWIQAQFAKELGVDISTIDCDEHIITLGLNSVKSATMIAQVQKDFNFLLASEILSEYPTINLLAHYLAIHHSKLAYRLVKDSKRHNLL